MKIDDTLLKFFHEKLKKKKNTYYKLTILVLKSDFKTSNANIYILYICTI